MTKLVVATSQFVADLNSSRTVIHDEPVVVQGASPRRAVDPTASNPDAPNATIYAGGGGG